MRILPSLLMGCLAAGTTLGAERGAQDTVHLQSKSRSTPDAIRGTIVDYNAEKIVVRAPYTGVESSYPADDVLEVRTPQTEMHTRGLRQFSNAEYRAAEEEFSRALDDEQRGWVRREILAMLIRCALKRGDYAAAGSRFLLLVGKEPRTRHFRLLPLAWSKHSVDDPLIQAGRSWMTQTNEAAQLLGAAALLFDPLDSHRAEAQLDRLRRSTDQRVRELAQFQLWRKRGEAVDLDLAEIDLWSARIEEVPQEIRGGPYYVLGEALWRHKDYDRAVWALAWLPLVYEHDTHLAGRSSLLAAEALLQAGQTVEAKTLYHVTTRRFKDTPFARQAAKILLQLRQSNDVGRSTDFPRIEDGIDVLAQ